MVKSQENKLTLFGCPSGHHGNTVVLGLPIDNSSIGSPGSKKAPGLLRFLSHNHSLRNSNLQLHTTGRNHIIKKNSVSDIGDIVYSTDENPALWQKDAVKLIKHLVGASKKILVLGGDHLVTLPALTALDLALGTRFQVLHLDAHTDSKSILNTSFANHENFMSFAARLKNLDRIVQVGIRGIQPVEAIRGSRKFIRTTFSEFLDCLDPALPLYITIDTDVLDPFLAPAVSHPVPQGATWANVSTTIDQITSANFNVVGADWVEYNPDFDTKNFVTGHAMLEVLFQLLHLLSANSKRKKHENEK